MAQKVRTELQTASLYRTIASKKRRAETRALHRVMSSPLVRSSTHVASGDLGSSPTDREDETEDIEDDMDEADPEVRVSIQHAL